MRISTMACHALHLLLCLSEQSDAIPASASELAACTGISEKFVQKIMRLLQAEGIVKSLRGIAGGHILARSPDAITLADIIAAVEGGITLPGVAPEAPRGKTGRLGQGRAFFAAFSYPGDSWFRAAGQGGPALRLAPPCKNS